MIAALELRCEEVEEAYAGVVDNFRLLRRKRAPRVRCTRGLPQR